MYAAFKGKCHHCGHDHDEDRAPAPMAEVTEDAGALNGLLDRLQAAVWSAAHVRQYDLTGQESARAKISAIRQEIRDHCCKRVIRAHEANGAVIKAAQRLHAAINAAEINYDSWHGKPGAPTPPSHEVQQALSKECVEADEEMTNALSAFLAGRMR